MLTHLGTSRCRNENRFLATNAPKGRASYAVHQGNALEGRGFCGAGHDFLPSGLCADLFAGTPAPTGTRNLRDL
ncbi:hypothetical protein PRJ_1473 [Pseudomonas sp. XWY-1]|nr:hypothetical protein PRJ_1473 [Pseudomonas sp. XWY-1]